MSSDRASDHEMSEAGRLPMDEATTSPASQQRKDPLSHGSATALDNKASEVPDYDGRGVHVQSKQAKPTRKSKISAIQKVSSYFSGSAKAEVMQPDVVDSSSSQDSNVRHKLEALYAELEQREELHGAQIQNLEREKNQQRRELSEIYDLEIRKVQRAKSDLQRELSEAQTRSNQLFEQLTQGKLVGRWNPLPDEEIRRRVQNLNNDVTDWVVKWAVQSLDMNGQPQEARNSFVKSLSGFVNLSKDGSLPTVIIKPSPKMRERIPALLLSGHLWHAIHLQFFNNHFWCFPGHANALHDVYRELVKSDRQEAQLWRCSLWRLLQPPETTDMTESQREVHAETNKRIGGFCDAVAEHFERKRANPLLRHEPESSQQDRTRQLRKILWDAASIATLLCRQDGDCESIDLKFIQRHSLVFDVTSPFLQRHRQSRIRGVDDDDAVNNGRKILVVARPGLVKIDDNRRGNVGDGDRALTKAIVLLGEGQ